MRPGDSEHSSDFFRLSRSWGIPSSVSQPPASASLSAVTLLAEISPAVTLAETLMVVTPLVESSLVESSLVEALQTET